MYKHAIRLAEKAAYKVDQDFPEGVPEEPEVHIPDPACVRLPGAPEPLDSAYFE